jgi:hypothetical protein
MILSVGLMVGLLYFSIQQSILRSAAEIESERSRLLAEQLTVQRDVAVKNNLREFEMLTNLTALLINNPSKELAVLRETSLSQYQVILDNLMTDS